MTNDEIATLVENVVDSVLQRYVFRRGLDEIPKAIVVREVVEKFKRVYPRRLRQIEKQEKARMDEFERDRLSEPPGEWKSAPGFVGPGGWRS